MKNNELIKHIESTYDVKSIKYKNLNLWLSIRNRLFAKIILNQESTLKINSSSYKTILLTSFYGFFNWFKTYDAWIFSSKINRLKIGNTYQDRLYEYIGSKFDKTLFIEVTTDKHYKRKNTTSKYIASKSLLILLEKIIGVFISTKKINLKIINEIKAEYNIDFNPNYSVKKIITQYKLMKFILKFKKPKVVFISPGYTAYGYVKALKEKGVKVIEVQHGVINKQHIGYNIYQSFNTLYFADYLLSFGKNEIEVFKGDNKGINFKNVIPVGNYYLDYILTHHKPDKTITKLKNNYDKSFVVSLQELESPLKIIPEIIKAANINKTFLFIFKPRKYPKTYYTKNYNLPNNIVVEENSNIYQLILDTDFHITVYSTTALEAPALGKFNILYNIDNRSREIFGDTLTNKKTTQIVDNFTEFNELIKHFNIPSSELIKNEHKNVIISNYKQNIDKFVKEKI
jgi:hypothetical protein